MSILNRISCWNKRFSRSNLKAVSASSAFLPQPYSHGDSRLLPRGTLHQHYAQGKSERSKLGTELQRQLSELGRSKPFRDASSSFNELTALLIRSAEAERAGLERAIESILKTTEVIPLDSDMFHRAATIQTALDMSIQDSIVFASVIHHLNETKPAESCFLNRNTNDFDDPNVREMLEEFGCKFFGRFDSVSNSSKHGCARHRNEQRADKGPG